MTKQIKSFRLNSLRVEEHFGFIQECLSKLPLLPAGKAVLPQTNFSRAVEEENKSLYTSVYGAMTKDVAHMDKLQDISWNGLRRFVVAMLLFPEEEVKLAAKRVKAILDTYGDPRKQPYMQAEGTYEHLLENLEKEEVTADLKKISAYIWLPQLKKYHEEFQRVFHLRNTAASIKGKGASTQARKRTDSAYRKLIQVINALAVLEGEEAYATYIDEMNELIAYQQAVFARRKAVANNKA